MSSKLIWEIFGVRNHVVKTVSKIITFRGDWPPLKIGCFEEFLGQTGPSRKMMFYRCWTSELRRYDRINFRRYIFSFLFQTFDFKILPHRYHTYTTLILHLFKYLTNILYIPNTIFGSHGLHEDRLLKKTWSWKALSWSVRSWKGIFLIEKTVEKNEKLERFEMEWNWE